MLRSSFSYVHYTFVHIFRIIAQSMSVSPLPCELRGSGFVFSSLYLSAGAYNGLYNIMGLNKYLSDVYYISDTGCQDSKKAMNPGCTLTVKAVVWEREINKQYNFYTHGILPTSNLCIRERGCPLKEKKKSVDQKHH